MKNNGEMYLTNWDRNSSSTSASPSKGAKLSARKQEGTPYQLIQQASNNGVSASPSETSGGEGSNDVNSLYLDEIQKAASEKNYKTLLQSDIAAYNLKMNTQKYLSNSLASSGLNTQGYGTSAHTGVENAAQNLYAENLANYNEAEQTAQTAAETRADAKSTENDNQLVTYLQYSDGSDEQIANYMANYGYAQDANGVWKDANGNEASAYVLSAIESAKNNNSTDTETKFAETAKGTSEGITSDDYKAIYTNGNELYSDSAELKAKFGDDYRRYTNELKYMFTDSTFQESVTNGLTVHLVNGSKDEYGAYFVYYNGAWYKTTAEYFSKASNKQTIKGK